jgi:Arc/MetJ-type ribon-helix-helix transcriptional regulator
MPRLTITIDDDQSDLLDDLTGEDGEYESKSAAVRDFIQAGEQRKELEDEIDRLRDRLESREERIDELEAQLRRRSNIEDEIANLPDKIRREQTYTDRRRRVLDSASTIQRLKWQITGVPTDRIDDAVPEDDPDE